MARKPAKQMKRRLDDDDLAVIDGSPTHSEGYDDAEDQDDEGQGDEGVEGQGGDDAEDGGGGDETAAGEGVQAQIEALRAQNADLMSRIDLLTRAIPPARQADPEGADPRAQAEPDWNTLIFDDPAAAARLITERAVAEAERRLTAKYQQETGKDRFWDKFFAKHNDLEESRDLVELLLQRNLGTLSPLPVAQAMDKLAALTRDRIASYAGRRRAGKKASAEGSERPLERRAAEPGRPMTLSDLLKQRAMNRRQGKGRAA